LSSHQIITRTDTAKIERLFELVVVPTLLTASTPKDGQTAGVLEVCDQWGTVKVHVQTGTASKRTFGELDASANRQNLALHKHPGITTSWQARSVKQDIQPGAIRTPDGYRLAMAGFTWGPQQDSLLWLAKKLHWIGIAKAAKIANVSGRRQYFLWQSQKLDAALQRLNLPSA